MTATYRAAFSMAVMSLVLPGAACGDDASDLVAIEKSLAMSVVDLDFETLDRVYADDFVFAHSTGVVETKDDWFRFLRENERFYTFRSVDSIKVELHGDIAVTDGRIHIKTRSEDPKRKEFTVWYIRVYERRDGDWQLISHRSVDEKIGSIGRITALVSE